MQYRENQNPELTAQANKRYYRQNVAQFVAHTALRRTRKLQATPEWADLAVIRKMYAEAKRLDDETGVKHHVDHIVPLKHPLVCGLHCEANLRVIPAKDNFAKNNRYWPNMPNGN